MKVEWKANRTYLYDLKRGDWELINLIHIREGDIFMNGEDGKQFLAIADAKRVGGDWTVEVSEDFSDLLLYYNILPKEVL